MKPKKLVALLVALTAFFVLSLAAAEAVSVNLKVLTGQMRIVNPDGKIVTVTHSGQTFDLKDATKIEMISGSATLQFGSYMVNMKDGQSLALRVSPKNGAVSLAVVKGSVKVESPKQSWIVNAHETALLQLGSGRPMSGAAMTPGAHKGDVMARGNSHSLSASIMSQAGHITSQTNTVMVPGRKPADLLPRNKVGIESTATSTNAVNTEAVSTEETTTESPLSQLGQPLSPRGRMAAPVSRDFASPLAAPLTLIVNPPITNPQTVKYASPSAP